jgi:pimeloyl-ACP methyl ester carboxylesterase
MLLKLIFMLRSNAVSDNIINNHTKTLTVNDLSFPVVDYGEGKPIILLHGFPDSRYLWRYQIPALAEAGFRVIAPDLRGFGDASKPEAVEDYALKHIIGDVVAMLDTLEIETTMVIGHDWGAAVAWGLTAYYQQRVEKLVALSVGCPGTSGSGTLEQRERSWYMYFFQYKDTAEAWLQHDNWKLFREWTRSDGDTSRHIHDLSRPGALTAGLNWYRANIHPAPPAQTRPTFPRITCPVLGIWSDGDNYLTESQMRQSYENVEGEWAYKVIRGASHWFMLEKAEELNRLLLDFLTETKD